MARLLEDVMVVNEVSPNPCCGVRCERVRIAVSIFDASVAVPSSLFTAGPVPPNRQFSKVPDPRLLPNQLLRYRRLEFGIRIVLNVFNGFALDGRFYD